MRLVSGFGAVVVSVSVAAILLDCGFERYRLIGFNPAWCPTTAEIVEAVSESAGVGFLAFLVLEGIGMIIASMWLEKERKAAEQLRREEAERAEQLRREEAERAERRMDAAERRAEAAERMAEVAERRAEAAERLRREEAASAERRAEAAERREERLLALLERRNGGSAQRGSEDESGAAQG